MTEQEKQRVSLPETFFVIATHYPEEDPRDEQPIPPVDILGEARVAPLAVELAEGVDPFVIVFSERETLDAFVAAEQFDIPAVVSEIPPSNLIELLEVCLHYDFAGNVLLDPPPWDDLPEDPHELMMFPISEFIEATKEAYRRHG